MVRSLLAPLLLSVALVLSGCESAEEKAERYYQSGLAYLAEGDEDRAMIEFRNVFNYDGFHKEARQTYADLLLKRGETQDAYSQYLRLIEQYPDTPEVRRTLAELAISAGNWDEATRHGEAAFALAPQDPAILAVKQALDYREATLARDEAAKDRIAEEARVLLEAHPENRIARRILLDRLLTGSDPASAMPVIEAGLATDPKAIDLHMLKFRLLAEAQDREGTGTQLKKMYELFPESQEVQKALISWYLVTRDIDGAEAFLRELAGAPTASPDGHLAVVQLLEAARGAEAAKAELTHLVEANAGTPNADLYGAALAMMQFRAGNQAEAISAMEGILKTAEPTDQTRKIKAMLAQMLDATGNRVGARALVEEVLAEDVSNVPALKLRANWLIAEERSGDAIIDLRAALDQAPRDPEILTLMAAAHEREGNLDLAGERLAMAVEVSGQGPAESLRYAGFLARQNRNQAAETVLRDARRASPGNADVLVAQTEFYLNQRNWPLAQEALTALKALNPSGMAARIQGLEATLLVGQKGLEEGLAFLENEVASGENAASATAMIIQAQIRSGKLAEARASLDAALATTPDDVTLRLLSALTDNLQGDAAKAEAQYRALIADQPQLDAPVRLLYALLSSTGKTEQAGAVLAAGIAAIPGSGTLKWIQAGHLEKAGDIDGAIAVYEALYAADSNNVIIANNLASMITTWRDDPESLAKAENIARRLRGSDQPAFQDTYGWIAYRTGNLDEALAHLEPAAKALPDEATVQYHLGMVYAAKGRRDEAIRQLELALSLGGDPLPALLEPARAELDRLKSGAATPEGGTKGG